MENPFYRNRKWYEQPDLSRRTFSRSPSFRSVPAHPIQHPPSPKVVQIPVRFVSSEPIDRSGSALRIQKVFRGFLVRKNMKRIKDVKLQVDEIEQKFLRSDVVKLIRSNEKERLRMSESLMSLLFKLDSVRGVDLGVRDCRKTVTRKVIVLQERIDSIIALNFDKDGKNAVIIEQEPEIRASEETDRSDQLEDHDDKYEWFVEMLDESGEELEGMDNDLEIENIVDVGVDCEVKVSEGNYGKEESFVENDEKDKENDSIDVQGNGEVKERHGDDGNKRNNELMDRMMKENEKMMMQLLDSNEKQMKMLSALAHRVEMLEKAFLCNNLRKMKNKKKKSGAAPCGEE